MRQLTTDQAPDEVLIDRAVDGDRAAQDELWRLHRAWMGSVLRSHLSPGVDVQDLMQDVALQFVRSITGLRSAKAFRGWLRTLAINAAQSASRYQRVRLRLTESEPLDSGNVRDDAHQAKIEAGERLAEVQAAIEQLPADQREVLVLRSSHGLSQRDLAEMLGATENAIESRLARARRSLRSILQQRKTDLGNRSRFKDSKHA